MVIREYVVRASTRRRGSRCGVSSGTLPGTLLVPLGLVRGEERVDVVVTFHVPLVKTGKVILCTSVLIFRLFSKSLICVIF